MNKRSHQRPPVHAGLPFAVAVIALLSGCDREPALIGVSTSDTYVDAARMAVEDAFPGGLPSAYDTVMIPESSNLAAPAIATAQTLVGTAGIVAVIGHSNSAASLAASQIYNGEEVLQLAPHSSAAIYSEAGPFSFRLVPSDDRQGSFLAEHLNATMPAGSKIAVLYVNDDYGRGLRRSLLDGLGGGPLEVALDLPHTEAGASADLDHLANGLRDVRPDVIVWLGRASSLAEYLPPIHDGLGSDVPIIGGDAVSAAVHLPVPAAGWGNVAFVSFVDLDASEALRVFARRYADRFGRPATGPDALTYDAVRLLLDGLQVGADSGAELREFLQSIGRSRPAWTGITGPVRFDEAGDVTRGYSLTSLRPGDGP